MAQRDSWKALETARAEVERINAELAKLAKAPCSRDEAEAAVDRWLGERARGMSVTVDGFMQGEASGAVMPSDVGPARGAVNGDSAIVPLPPVHGNVEAALAAVAPDAVKALLMQQIDARLGDREGINASERARRRQELQAKLFGQEQAEEAAVRDLEAQGYAPLRRPEADPRVVLDLAAPPPADSIERPQPKASAPAMNRKRQPMNGVAPPDDNSIAQGAEKVRQTAEKRRDRQEEDAS